MAKTKPIPLHEENLQPMPMVGKAENTVTIGDQQVEIKPTKLKYQRNKTANFYKILELYPLMEILSWNVGYIGEDDDRDGDKAVFDWLIAVTDDEELIKKFYDEITTDTVDSLVKIFKRLNKIDEKEEALKNALREKSLLKED